MGLEDGSHLHEPVKLFAGLKRLQALVNTNYNFERAR